MHRAVMGFAPLNPSYLLVMKQMDAGKAEREMEMRRRQQQAKRPPQPRVHPRPGVRQPPRMPPREF